MAITPLPTAPTRADSSTFAARADAFVAALPPWGAQLNALASAIDASAALVNYKGEYSASTTYTLGQAVTYSGAIYYAKKSNTGITPVDGADWYLIRVPVLRISNSLALIGVFSISAGAAFDASFSVSGAAVGDAVVVNWRYDTGVQSASILGLILSATVTAANTVVVQIRNVTSAAITPANTGTTFLDVTVIKK